MTTAALDEADSAVESREHEADSDPTPHPRGDEVVEHVIDDEERASLMSPEPVPAPAPVPSSPPFFVSEREAGLAALRDGALLVGTLTASGGLQRLAIEESSVPRDYQPGTSIDVFVRRDCYLDQLEEGARIFVAIDRATPAYPFTGSPRMSREERG